MLMWFRNHFGLKLNSNMFDFSFPLSQVMVNQNKKIKPQHIPLKLFI